MNALRTLLLLSVALTFAACNANPPEACQAACAKGISLAKAALIDATKDQSQEAKDEALNEWKVQEAGLNAGLSACTERCTRDPNPELLGCLDAAKSLQAYTGCLK
jgi:hypothetical protein